MAAVTKPQIFKSVLNGAKQFSTSSKVYSLQILNFLCKKFCVCRWSETRPTLLKHVTPVKSRLALSDNGSSNIKVVLKLCLCLCKLLEKICDLNIREIKYYKTKY